MQRMGLVNFFTGGSASNAVVISRPNPCSVSRWDVTPFMTDYLARSNEIYSGSVTLPLWEHLCLELHLLPIVNEKGIENYISALMTKVFNFLRLCDPNLNNLQLQVHHQLTTKSSSLGSATLASEGGPDSDRQEKLGVRPDLAATIMVDGKQHAVLVVEVKKAEVLMPTPQSPPPDLVACWVGKTGGQCMRGHFYEQGWKMGHPEPN